jgi:biotin carboxyl carrier protein
MIFFVRHGGVEHTVRVESRQQKLLLKFDDEPEQVVDMAYFGNDVSFIQNRKVFFANVVGAKDEATVFNPRGNLQLEVESEYRRIVGLLRGQDLDGENNVYAKMPGKIAKLTAKLGDVVEKGTSLLVMEAMKMENEIRSTMAGKVTNICVKEGQAVETGALLVELSPTDSE